MKSEWDSAETHFGIPLMQMAKSFVMKPASMVSTQTASRASENTRSSVFLSSFARWSRPRVHAKIEAAKHKNNTGEGRIQCKNPCTVQTMLKSPQLLQKCIWCIFPTDGVGGGLFPLLMLPVMTGHCAMCSLRLYCASIRTNQHTCHHSQRAITWDKVTVIRKRYF